MNEVVYEFIKNTQDYREHFMVGSPVSSIIGIFYEWMYYKFIKKNIQDYREHFMVGSPVSSIIVLFYE